MNHSSQLDLLNTSQTLADKGDFEQALACIEIMNCVMGEWLKGKVNYIPIGRNYFFKLY